MKTDVAIIGGGPGGSAHAIFLARKGLQSIIIEKDSFPRFHIGESMTGECGVIVRSLGLEQEMVNRKHPVKHGVKVFGPEGKNSFWVPVMRRDENNKLLESNTWQVRRSDFDQMMLDRARDHNATIVNRQAVKVLQDAEGTINGVRVRMEDTGDYQDIEAKVVVDASGYATFLSNAGVAGKKERGKYDRQLAVFSHVKGAQRDEQDNTLIFFEKKNHWAWFIPIDQETVSIGVVTPSTYYREQNEKMPDYFRREIHKINLELSQRVSDIELVEDIYGSSNYSYHIKNFTGKNYLCIGDSHRFIDPIFSFGLNVALADAMHAADAVADFLLNGQNSQADNPFADFKRRSELGLDALEDLVDCFWANPFAFSVITHIRYKEDLIDLFAGRVYKEEPPPGLLAIRKLNAQVREEI